MTDDMSFSNQYRRTTIFLLAVFLILGMWGCADDDASLASKSRRVFGPLPDAMPGAEQDSSALVSLGRELFVSTELSVNRMQSCQSCHRLDSAGVDRMPTSPGALGERGQRNTPTIINAGFHKAQFWDGRVATLEEQATGPILNPIEMGMPSEEIVLDRLRQSALRDRFAGAFPEDPDPVTMKNLTAALAAFQRTLVSRNRFDEFQEGRLDALSPEEKTGLRVFMDTGCASCHGGPLLGGNIFQKIGIVNPYENGSDLGRAEVTKRDRDRFVFKVPSLRNVALTAPYFHDGSVPTLEAAVERMAWLQLGYEIPDEERDAIVTFLRALSDERGDAVLRGVELRDRVEAAAPADSGL